LKIQTIDFPSADKIPSILDEYIMAMDEPNSNATGLSMMCLYSQISKDGHRLVLTGDGADEIFGGYERYKIADKFRKYPKFSGRYINKVINQNNLNLPFLRKLAIVFSSMDSVESWQYWQQIAGVKTIKKIFPDLPNFQFSIFGNELTNIFQENNKVANLMFRDIRTWLSMESNQKLDRISMWHSIEARSPFQSENVLAIGYKKMKEHSFKDLNKELLFEAFPKLNSLSINENKSGFISPLGYWLRKNPELVNSSLSNLSKNFNFNKNELSQLSNSPENKSYRNFKLLWSLIVFERWFTLSAQKKS
jgi:asparagine synthase (glutamine-hydrolysing)